MKTAICVNMDIEKETRGAGKNQRISASCKGRKISQIAQWQKDGRCGSGGHGMLEKSSIENGYQTGGLVHPIRESHRSVRPSTNCYIIDAREIPCSYSRGDLL